MRNNYDQFTTVTYSGKELLKKHSLDETGVWKVLGEDPNCDMGGSHHQPFLGIFEGKLEDVIRHAVQLKRFWQWGAGGSIQKVEIIQLDPEKIAEAQNLREEYKAAKAEAKRLQKSLNDLGIKV